MIKKRETKNYTKVTFELEHLADAELVEVLGDFNEWQPEAMTKYKNGKHKLTVDLDKGQEYQFRYRIDGERWENDDQADDYAPNEFGEKNSVVVC